MKLIFSFKSTTYKDNKPSDSDLLEFSMSLFLLRQQEISNTVIFFIEYNTPGERVVLDLSPFKVIIPK